MADYSPPHGAAAFDDLFRRLVNPICRFIDRYVRSKDVAAELAQDTFLQVWRKVSAAEPIGAIEAYVYTTARHVALSYLRRRGVEARYAKDRHSDVIAKIGVAAEGEQSIGAGELAAAIQRAIDELPPRQREVILMKWRRQATHEEIATALGIDPDTVSQHYRKALAHLRRTLPPLLS